MRAVFASSLALPALLLAAGLALIHTTGADPAITDRFYDPATRTFPLRESFWTYDVLHDLARDATVVLGLGALALALAGPRRVRPAVHEAAVMVLLSLVLSTIAVSAIKAVVYRHCPWSYARYGGPLPDVEPGAPLFSLEAHEPAWPCGHASGAFSLLVLYFVGRRHTAAAARTGLAIGLCAGALLGFTQVVRGAHFVSHVLWTAAICWYLAFAVDALVPRRLY